MSAACSYYVLGGTQPFPALRIALRLARMFAVPWLERRGMLVNI